MKEKKDIFPTEEVIQIQIIDTLSRIDEIIQKVLQKYFKVLLSREAVRAQQPTIALLSYLLRFIHWELRI